jgi:phage terminase large subunit-like protein
VFDETAIGWEQHEYARQVAEDAIDDWAFLPVLYGAPTEADWTDPRVWAAANPSYGITVHADRFREECVEAQQSPAKENDFRRYRLNQWVQQHVRYVPMATWDAGAGHAVAVGDADGRAVCGGLDLSATRDLTALVWVWTCPHDPEAIDVAVRCWAPEAQLRDGRNRHLYEQWRRSGHLTITPGDAVDYAHVERDIAAEAERLRVTAINVDTLFQGQGTAQALTRAGLPIFTFGQGYGSMGPAMKAVERRWLEKRIHHGGHPILRWAVEHVTVRADTSGNLKPMKPTQDSPQKIDPFVALVMAVDRVERGDLRRPSFEGLMVVG